ncbi:pseudaminic acid cytidylyltransferase [Methylovorus sp. MM2]|nr:pseudaminic acid cytidylyltransferase [Methylovorus sp. MM2]
MAVIPARGGSKRVPRKNIRNFHGKPMIAWTIEAASSSGLFDHIIVSTDDSEIADVAMQYGADVPFVRPAELADDYAGTAEVIAHSTQWAIDNLGAIDALCCLYPTAPFVQVDDLKRGFDALNSGQWEYAFSVTEFASPIFRSFKQSDCGGLEMFFPEHFSKRSQDLPMALHDAGQFYWGRSDAWINKKRVFSDTSFPIFIPRWRVQDIDTEDDFRHAELMFAAFQSEFKRSEQ